MTWNVPKVGPWRLEGCRPSDPGLRDQLDALWALFRPYATEHWYTEFRNQPIQRFWEMQITVRSLRHGLMPSHVGIDASPDLRLDLPDGRPCWVEATAPTDGNASQKVIPRSVSFQVHKVDRRNNILRLTSAIRDKLIQRRRWVDRGRIGAFDPFVIALNASQIGHVGGSEFSDILGALAGVGGYTLEIDRYLRQVTGRYYEEQLSVVKRSDALGTVIIDTALFSGSTVEELSAVIYFGAGLHYRHPESELIVVHNGGIDPRRVIPPGFLPFTQEWAVSAERDARATRIG